MSRIPSDPPPAPADPPSPAVRRSGHYHHGDLKAALVDAAVGLIAERGVAGFSMAEASRRLGVTVAAPYRHFADRDELLAAVAVRALGALHTAVAAAIDPAGPPPRQLAAVAAAYVRFAAANPALFGTLFGAHLDKARFPGVQRAAGPLESAFLARVEAVCPEDPAAAAALAGAVLACAHGYATLLLDRVPASGTPVGRAPASRAPDDLAAAGEATAQEAFSATLALIAGRGAWG